ncbi:glycosyltransferase [Demequina sp. NBRC 110055]|uniref:glycosyltransferase n=1 Tax=Demequina sp. NBRC 110055 TaxID=1570344 RepID=UPI000A021D6E|nr:glycosyltransferase [Demequina sp. NBRC 110055]
MKIVVVLPSIQGGGAEYVGLTWARELAARGHNVTLALSAPPEPGAAPPELGIVLMRGGGLVRKSRSLARLIKKSQPDIVLSLMPFFNIMALTARLQTPSSIPVKVIISGRNVDRLSRKHLGLSGRVQELIAKALYRYCDGYVAISHPVAAEAISHYGIPQDKTVVVRNPAMGKVSEPGALQPRSAEASKHLSIVVPARLVAQKRPLLAVDIAAWLRDQGITARVHYFGAGPLLKEIQIYGARRDVDIEMHGSPGDWFERIPVNSVVVLPSYTEGFGNVLVEATALGFPVVAYSGALGVADAVIHGVTGLLVDIDRVETWGASVLKASTIQPPYLSEWLLGFSIDESTDALERVLIHFNRGEDA